MLWVVLVLMTAAAAAAVVVPLLRPAGPRSQRGAYDRQVYRDQLNEVEADVDRGVVTAEEAAGARREIERRLLATEPDDVRPVRAAIRPHYVAAGAIAVVVPALGLAVYLTLGTPAAPELVAVHRPPAAPADSMATAGDLDSRTAELAARLEGEPNDLGGWLLLGRSYSVLARYEEAVAAFRRAAALAPGNADVQATLGEGLVLAADGIVEDRAVSVFEVVLTIDQRHPAARYFMALARAQRGAVEDAFERWRALLDDTPADATYRPEIEARIREAAVDLGRDVAEILPERAQASSDAASETARGPSREDIEAAAQMSADEQAAMIRGMVEGLAGKLEESPDDLEGWLRLARAYGVIEERDKAREAHARAARLRPADVAILLDYAGAIMNADESERAVPTPAADVLRRVLELDAENPGALYYLGLADAEAGRRDEAAATWRRLLARLEPGTEAYQTVETSLNALLAAP